MGTSTKNTTGHDSPPLRWALPPWHTVLLVWCLSGFLLHRAPETLELLDEVATVETFSKVQFPSIFPLSVVIAIRLAFSALMLGGVCCLYLVGTWEIEFSYYPWSKLKGPTRVHFKGALVGGGFIKALGNISSFTVWSFGLEGLAFLFAGLIPFFSVYRGWEIPQGVLRTALVLWMWAAPSAILVSVIVKYVLWEQALVAKRHTVLAFFKHPFVLIQHCLNSVAVFVEVGLLGAVPCRIQDVAVAPLFGIVYLVFSWCMAYSYVDVKKHGPQFRYPFLDTTLGAFASLALVALLVANLIFFCILAMAEYFFLEYLSGAGFLGHLAVVFLFSIAVCRLRD